MSFYQRHLFFCVNQRDDGACCADHDAEAMRDHAKRKLKALGLSGQGAFRVNRAGCLDRCAEGPVAVLYPDATWYRYESKEDVDEIVERHLVGGHIVERLKI